MSESPSSRLLHILSLLYRMQENEVKALAGTILDQRKDAWRSAITEEARQFGYTGPVNDPSRQDLTYLRDLSFEDARSIAATWNRDVERQLRRLYEANPRGNRNYYAKNMEVWAAERDVWKSQQIASQTAFTTWSYAKERFWQENGLRGGAYVFDGPPPVCEECVNLFALGVVTQEVVDRNPTPIHFGCPHEWTLITSSVPRLKPGDLWVG